MPEVHWNALVQALLRVEQLGADECGMLSFGPSSGGIFVERGRVCWVAAHGLQRRLSDLLRAHCSIDADELELIYQRCRARGKLLGQTLVAEGLLQPSELERALRRHSAESLVALCPAPQLTTWAAHPGRSYAPRFTLGVVDLLFDSVALFHAKLQVAARAELSAFGGPGRRGAAFVLDANSAVPLPLVQTSATSLQSMLTLGQSVAAIPLASHELGSTPAFTLARTASGESLLVWWRDLVLYAMWCEDRASLAAATAQHLACA